MLRTFTIGLVLERSVSFSKYPGLVFITKVKVKKGYTNLIKNLFVNRPNRVWCADITYVKVLGGFGYGVAIIDLYSRKVLSMEYLTLWKKRCV